MAEDLKIQIITEADNSGFKSAAASANDLEKATNAEGESAKNAGEHSENSALKHKILHKTIEQLNDVSPGLGSNLAMLAKGYQQAAVGAETASAANSAFLASMGPLAIAFLTIQAAATYWELYKSKSEEAADSQAKSSQKIVESLRAAREAQEAFNDSLNGANDSPTKKYDKKEKADSELLQDQIAHNKTILKVQEDAALATAKTEEEKAAVKKKYAGLNQKQDEYAEEITAGNKRALAGDIQSEINQKTQANSEVKQRIVDLGVNGDPQERSALTAQSEKLRKDVEALREKKNNLTDDADLGESRAARHKSTNSDVAREENNYSNPVIGRAVKEGNLNAKPGEEISASQREANSALVAVFSQYHGGVQTMLSVIKAQQAKGASQEQEIQALKNAQQSLASMSHR